MNNILLDHKMNSLPLILVIVSFIVLIIVSIIIAVGSSLNRIAIISQLTIPNISGHEKELQHYTNHNKLVFYNTITTDDIFEALKDIKLHQINKVILSIDSSSLLDLNVANFITNNPTITFIANASTAEGIKENLPHVYYLLTPDNIFINKAFNGFYLPLSANQNVFIYAGSSLYVEQSLEIAQSKGFYIINANGETNFSEADKDAINGSKSIFISALDYYHDFITTQIVSSTNDMYEGFVIYLNIGPTQNYHYPMGSRIHVIYPGSTLVLSETSSWNQLMRTKTKLAHPLLQCLPTLVSIDWSSLINSYVINQGSSNLSTTVIWSNLLD
jgi:hypothetical protein